MNAHSFHRWIFLLLFIPLLASCGYRSNESSQSSYKDTKSLVLDVLRTKEAQKAIQEASQKNQDKTMRLLSTGEGQQIQLAISEYLTSAENSAKLLEATIKDPKFAGKFAKAIEEDNKKLHKDLMKDPQYQQSMLSIMENPEYEKLILNTLKSATYREQVMLIIQESLQSPLFKAEILSLLQHVVQEGIQPKGSSQSNQDESSSDKDSKSKQKKDEQGSDNGDENKKKDSKEDQADNNNEDEQEDDSESDQDEEEKEKADEDEEEEKKKQMG